MSVIFSMIFLMNCSSIFPLLTANNICRDWGPLEVCWAFNWDYLLLHVIHTCVIFHLTVCVNCTCQSFSSKCSGCLFNCDICSPYCLLTTDIIWCIWRSHLTGFLLSNCSIKIRMSSHRSVIIKLFNQNNSAWQKTANDGNLKILFL